MSPSAIFIDYLNGLDIQALAMNDAEILAAVEGGLVAQGNGQTVIEPRVHLEPNPDFHGHFNVLRGYVAPLETAGVKIVGDVSTTGRLSEKTLHAELGQIVAGLKPGREREDETILFWHRGLSLSDIALGKAMLAKAQARGIGQRLRFA